MAFSGGFGGFGQNNNAQQQQSTGFGGFGQNNNNNNTTGTGFGSNNAFGTSNNNASGGIFGGSSGGFGNSGESLDLNEDVAEDVDDEEDSELTGTATGFGSGNTSGFGAARPGTFGSATATTGTGLFGSNNTSNTTTNNAFGGSAFGGNNASTTSSPFGGGLTGGTGLFGASKPAFGAAVAPTPFGTTNSNTSAFGASPGAFGGGGIGGNVPDSTGTASTPFQPFMEKEANSSAQQAYQSVCFMSPYIKYSPEELRLADYAQGRRYGNANGQGGAFGTSSGFGGFSNSAANTAFGSNNNNNASTGGGLFGQQATPNTGFGSSTTTGFGSNTAASGTGLFGAKPATGLFGSTPAQTGTGLFGSTGNTNNAFGSNNTSSPFGTNNNNNTSNAFGASTSAAKPFSFGNTSTGNTSTGLFGTSGNTGTSLFGQNTQAQANPSPFGQAQQPAATTGFGGFGQQQQPQQTGATSLFGASNQPKPGLFGSAPTTTTGGLFGNSQQTNTTSIPFGAPATNTQSNQTSLFGAKPAGTGLFGNANQPTTGTGLFGSLGQNQTQQQSAPSLFGGLNNNQPKPSLFGQQPQQTGTGLFGSQPAQQSTGLFGASSISQQQPQNSLFGGNNSMLGNSQGQQAPTSLTASINDAGAYGSPSLFAGLNNSQSSRSLGPIATPLSSSTRPRKVAALPLYKLTPASASRFNVTPQKRGYGFSQSAYSTPGSVSSTASTPGLMSNSFLGGSRSLGLNKSVSTSSLRRAYSAQESILSPGSFSASSNARGYGSTGSLKKLTISKSLRNDLFTQPSSSQTSPAPTNGQTGILKKRVSFNNESVVESTENGSMNTPSPLKQITNNSPSEDRGYIRSRKDDSSTQSTGNDRGPEMEEVRNNELAIVPEEDVPGPNKDDRAGNKKQRSSSGRAKLSNRIDNQAGEYWMRPSKEQIEALSREQRQKVEGFTIGREHCGEVQFDQPVDLVKVNINELYDKIVCITVRQITVYPVAVEKPPLGQGLNVPSTITLRQMFFRSNDMNLSKQEKRRAALVQAEFLKAQKDCETVTYDAERAIWVFKVPHFTTYGFGKDDCSDEEVEEYEQDSPLSELAETPAPPSEVDAMALDQSFGSDMRSSRSDSEPEDTFEFKKRQLLPGSFDLENTVEEDDEPPTQDESMQGDSESFLADGSVGPEAAAERDDAIGHVEQQHDDGSVSVMDQEMAGSFPEADPTTEPGSHSQTHDQMEEEDDGSYSVATPGAILRARLMAGRSLASPAKSFVADTDWASTLKSTISPRKQDRNLLKSALEIDSAAALGNGGHKEPVPKPLPSASTDARGFATSLDLLASLFGQSRSPEKPSKPKGFQWPYPKRPRQQTHGGGSPDETESVWHQSLKPNFGFDGTFVYATHCDADELSRSSRRRIDKDGLLVIQKGAIVAEGRDIRFAKFASESASNGLQCHKALTDISLIDDIPFAGLRASTKFTDFFHDTNSKDPATIHEKLCWQLAHILWGATDNKHGEVGHSRRDALSDFWKKLVEPASTMHAAMARTAEEKAIAALAGHRVAAACNHLVEGKDYHLATLIALIGSSQAAQQDMQKQLHQWQKSSFLSEFSQPVRALYELIAGNVCVCKGQKGAPEERIESFVISKRFGLDWRQAFGLRLWYLASSGGDLIKAIEAFQDDLDQDREMCRPVPWYVEQKIPSLGEDIDSDDGEDVLYGILKLYAGHGDALSDILRPENSQLSPLDYRFVWQFAQALSTIAGIEAPSTHNDQADQLTLCLASQLTREGSWLDAIFVLLHLFVATARELAVKDHLARHAGLINTFDSELMGTLTQQYHLPEAWLFEAKALHMRSVQHDPVGEVYFLQNAGSYVEAHRTLIKTVAPQAVVERDFDALRDILVAFKGHEQTIFDWTLGGQIYNDFLELMDANEAGAALNHGTLDRLLRALPSAMDASRQLAFMERVAFETMAADIAKAVTTLHDEGVKMHKVLGLPLTEDQYLKHTMNLSLVYYRHLVSKPK